MTTRYRRLIGRVQRRRAQRVPLRSQQAAMACVIDRGGPQIDRFAESLAPLLRHIIELIDRDEAAARRRPLLHNGRKP